MKTFRIICIILIIQYVLFWALASSFQRFIYKTGIKNCASFFKIATFKNIKHRISDICISVSFFSTLLKTTIFTVCPILLYLIDTFFHNIHPKLCNLYLMYIIVQLTFVKVDSKEIVYKHHKFYWESLFLKNNIPTPITIGKIINGQLSIISRAYDPNKKYVIKPDIGSCATNIRISTVNDFMKNPINKDYIIQEFIKSCKHKKEFFRIVTMNEENTVKVIYSSKTEISDTGENNFSVFKRNNIICNDNYCKEPLLKLSINPLIKIHSTDELNHVPFIAWDVVVDCDKIYILEGNFPFGGIRFNNKHKQNKFYANLKKG